MKSFLPLCLDVSEARIVVVGGGKVALQKLVTIATYAPDIHVFAPEILPEIKALPVRWSETAYHPSLLDGAFLVYACTDDRAVNRSIAADGRAHGLLVNAADDPGDCDFVSPAIFRMGDMSVAVSSNGLHPLQSVRWRNALRDLILSDPDRWREAQADPLT